MRPDGLVVAAAALAIACTNDPAGVGGMDAGLDVGAGVRPGSDGGDSGGPLPCCGRVPPGCSATLARPPAMTDEPLQGGFVRDLALESLLSMADTTPQAGDRGDLTSVLLADLDGDGRVDMIHNRNGRTLGHQPRSLLAMQAAGGGFPAAVAMPGGLAQCSLVADLDGDGRVDVYCAYPVGAVYWGGADGHGPRWDAPTMVPDFDSRDTMGASAWDVDEDGLLDVVVSNFGEPKRIYRNRGDRTFESVATAWGLDVSGLTFAVVFHDLDGDGRPDVYIMNDGSLKPNYGFRALGPGADGEPRFTLLHPMPAMCDQTGLFDVGDATPMGGALADFSANGQLELVLAVENTSDAVLARQPSGAWLDVSPAMGIHPPGDDPSPTHDHWSPHIWDVDRDGLLDLLFASSSLSNTAAAGTSAPLLFRGRPDGTMTDIAALAGIGDPGDYLTSSLGDLDGDGDLDVVLAGFGAAARVYENRVIPSGHHVTLRFRGQTSAPDGSGAQVTVTAGGVSRAYQVHDTFPLLATPPPEVDATLAMATQADTVRVLWPSGYTQVVGPFHADTVQVVTEPPVLTVSTASRHVRADGSSTVTVTVHPLDERGAPRPTAAVAIELTVPGGAAWMGPVQRAPDGTATRTLRASSTAGSSVIEAHIDGTAVRVRPRIWWNAG